MAGRPQKTSLTRLCAQRIRATFVCAGISIERAGLLPGTRGEQIGGLFGIARSHGDCPHPGLECPGPAWQRPGQRAERLRPAHGVSIPALGEVSSS